LKGTQHKWPHTTVFIYYRTRTQSTQEHTIKTEERKNTEMYALMALLTQKSRN